MRFSEMRSAFFFYLIYKMIFAIGETLTVMTLKTILYIYKWFMQQSQSYCIMWIGQNSLELIDISLVNGFGLHYSRCTLKSKYSFIVKHESCWKVVTLCSKVETINNGDINNHPWFSIKLEKFLLNDFCILSC